MGQLQADGAVTKTGTGGYKDPYSYTSIAPDDRPTLPAI
jgi:hypothetical protein